MGLGLDHGRAGAGLGAGAIGLRSFPARTFIAAGKNRAAGIVAKSRRAAVKTFIHHRVDMALGNFT